jgi:uncharacterized protein DUF6894
MTQLYFHCSNTEHALIDRRGAGVADLIEAKDHATSVVRAMISAPNLQDWRGWMLHVSDDLGDEIFVLPFDSMLGKAN